MKKIYLSSFPSILTSIVSPVLPTKTMPILVIERRNVKFKGLYPYLAIHNYNIARTEILRKFKMYSKNPFLCKLYHSLEELKGSQWTHNDSHASISQVLLYRMDSTRFLRAL